MSPYDQIIQIGLQEAQRTTAPTSQTYNFDQLTSAGWKMDELDYDESRAALVATCLCSCGVGMNVCSGQEIPQLQDRLGRLLVHRPYRYFGELTNDLERALTAELAWFRRLFVTAIKLSTHQWGVGQGEANRDWGTPSNLDFGVAEPTVYLVLPLLEAVLKNALSNFVDADGVVQQRFTVTRAGRTETYAPTGPGRRRCNSVGDLLCLVRQQFSNLDVDLGYIFDHLKNVYQHEGLDWWTIIYNRWRNPALHGSTYTSTAGNVLLNIVLLVALADAGTRIRPVLGGAGLTGS